MKTRKRWKPKVGEKFWIVNSCGTVFASTWVRKYRYHTGLYKFGNCFPTEAKAIRARAAIRKALREVNSGGNYG